MEPKKSEKEMKAATEEQTTIEMSFELDAGEEELLEEFGVLYQVEYPNAA
ncbi:MAG: hypothetical protein H6650_14560 [Ardenticatenales bacterium]|nr:hypothetical protein [Ardenticatenales bacterium]